MTGTSKAGAFAALAVVLAGCGGTSAHDVRAASPSVPATPSAAAAASTADEEQFCRDFSYFGRSLQRATRSGSAYLDEIDPMTTAATTINNDSKTFQDSGIRDRATAFSRLWRNYDMSAGAVLRGGDSATRETDLVALLVFAKDNLAFCGLPPLAVVRATASSG